METQINHKNPYLTSVLSFEPLFRHWKEVSANGKRGAAELYNQLLSESNGKTFLQKPITDLEELANNRSLIEKFMATIFPVTLSDKEDFYAAAVPFTFKTFYSSSAFRETFLDSEGEFAQVPEGPASMRLMHEKNAAAYQLILKKLYGVNVGGKIFSVHPYNCPATGLVRFMEVELDSRFVDVRPLADLPKIPSDITFSDTNVQDVIQSPELMAWLPLENFSFEGFSVMLMREVTERESISNIKNTLLELESFADIDKFKNLQQQVQDLIGVSGIEIGITPFYKVNEEPVFLEVHRKGSILLKSLESENKARVATIVAEVFSKRKKPLFVPNITAENIKQFFFLEHIKTNGWCCIAIWPLYSEDKLVGTLEIVTHEHEKLSYSIVQKVEAAIPYFELALKRTAQKLEAQIDKVIKEQFTAVQSSVEWRFMRAALNYLQKVQYDEDTKVESIVFEDVYPLYGAIDVRNSSIERNKAIQQDLLEQLRMAGEVVKKARKKLMFPLLKEIAYKIRKYTHSASNIILSDEELSINDFLKKDILQLFQHLPTVEPGLKDDVENYFSALGGANADMFCKNRLRFDESITRINSSLAKFVDKEQEKAQEIYPHYFERFVTDGVDFNIYVGESISPGITYSPFYLKNIKLWHLTMMVKAARLTKSLEANLSLPLQTTQLVLAHSSPISISFRQAERKFDVDGAYNIRYEIIKKRIDKVHIRNSNERLTKPGTIAIVYMQPQEYKEYMQYIEFLQQEDMLTEKVEKLELEELQGVIGLKALRVEVAFNSESAPSVQIEDIKERSRN